jgi:16S rRNA (cytidine1402-2'-O)-methyltransferase
MTGTSALYIVATPIGNIDDISLRAIETLKRVDMIAAEDTRHSKGLLERLGIGTPLMAYHEHSGAPKLEKLLSLLEQGQSVALISDAGTPLISDPGYPLVAAARQRQLQVISVPGPCAVIAALAASGLPSDRFSFEGFLPAKSAARRKRMESLATDDRTLVFYEAPHRILECLKDATAIFGSDREALVAREISKTFETYLSGDLASLCEQVESDPNQQRGEIVFIVRAEQAQQDDGPSESDKRLLKLLLGELPASKAAALVAKFSGRDKKQLYQLAIDLK